MKKLFFLMLFVYGITRGQTTPFTSVNNLKITAPVEGAATDSVLVWRGSDKIVRWYKMTDIAGIVSASLSFQDVINNGSVANTSNGISISHASDANYSEVSLSDHSATVTAGNNQLAINADSASINSHLSIGQSINPNDAIQKQQVENTYIPYNGAIQDINLGQRKFYAGQTYIADDEIVTAGNLKDIFGIYSSSNFNTDTKGLYIVKDENGQLHVNNRGSGGLSSNCAFGLYSLTKNTTGTGNTSFGYASLYDNTTGFSNTAIGSGSMQNANGNYNTGVGSYTLKNATSQFNTAVGYQALFSITNGASNTGVGLQSLYKVTTGNFNTGFGGSALFNTTIGQYNTSLGQTSGNDLIEGNYNTFVGRAAGRPMTTGSYNLIVARGTSNTTEYAGVTTGNYNTLLGTVKGMAGDSNNWVVIADGNGNRAFEKNGTSGIVDIKGTSFTFNSTGLKASTLNITTTTTITSANIGSNGFLYIYADASAGNITITLPAAASINGYSIWVYRKDTSSNTVIIDANGSELINQSLTYSLTGINSNAKFNSDGTQMRVFN